LEANTAAPEEGTSRRKASGVWLAGECEWLLPPLETVGTVQH
jgi:hypothetical protein